MPEFRFKDCPKCRRVKPRSDFYRSKHASDGLYSWCKDCCKHKNQAQYRRKVAKIKVVPEFKTCPLCETNKPSADFWKAKGNRDGLSTYCRTCEQVRFQKNKSGRRDSARKSKYGLTRYDCECMYAKQNGRCAGCEECFSSDKLCVDHDHAAGLVRGLLCDQCNKALGNAKDNSETLKRLARYVVKGQTTLALTSAAFDASKIAQST